MIEEEGEVLYEFKRAEKKRFVCVELICLLQQALRVGFSSNYISMCGQLFAAVAIVPRHHGHRHAL